MISSETSANLVELMTTYNIELSALPDDLKCTQCKSVLRDACQLPCDCRFCRVCIDVMTASGHQFCLGGLRQCGGTPLSTAVPDYRANNSIMRLAARCPRAGCSHECPLADMDKHMRVCPRRNIECSFSELGCKQGALPGEEMSAHLLQESRSHSEILIKLVTNVNRDMEVLKRELVLREEQERHIENEMKVIIEENKSIKDEIKSIKTKNKSLNDENKLIKDEMKSVKVRCNRIGGKNIIGLQREKEVLSKRVWRLVEDLDREISERRQSDARASTGISAVTAAVESNRDVLGTEMDPVKRDIRVIYDQLDTIKHRLESTRSLQVAQGVGQLDDWLIDENVAKTEWGWTYIKKKSGKFRGGGRPHKYELSLWNYASRGELEIYLCIWACPSDALLEWPFRGTVTVTLANRHDAKKCLTETMQCRMKRPANNDYSLSEQRIKFEHAALRGAGLDLESGMCVSCEIVPSADQ